MMKKFLRNIFFWQRKYKLKNKWWHRFIQVAILGSTVFVFFFMYSQIGLPHRPDFYNYIYNFEKGFGDVKSKAYSCYRKDLIFRSYDDSKDEFCGDFGFHAFKSKDSIGYYKSTTWDSDFLNKYFKVIRQTNLLDAMRKKDYWKMGSRSYIDYQIMSLFWNKNGTDVNTRYETFTSRGLIVMDKLMKDQTGEYAFMVIDDDVPYTMEWPNYPSLSGGPIKTPMNVDNVPPYLQAAVSAFNKPTIQYKIVSSNYLKQIYWYGIFILLIVGSTLLYFALLELVIYRIIIYIIYGKIGTWE